MLLSKGGLLTNVAIPPLYAVGRYYNPPHHDGTPVVGQASVVGQTRFYPFIVEQPFTLSALGATVTTAALLSTFELAIYNATAQGMPNALLLQTAAIASTATGAISATKTISGTNIALRLTEGTYWVAIQSNVAGAAFMGVDGSSMYQGGLIGAASEANIGADGYVFYLTGTTYGTFPQAPTLTELAATTPYGVLCHYLVSAVG